METTATVTLAHGSGGLHMQDLLRTTILPPLDNQWLRESADAAVLAAVPGAVPVFTTDAFVVQPLFFPGGDIGHLAVCGTVNDLAMMGAAPTALSLALILEAGLPIAVLERVMSSVARTAAEAKVPIVTGDTKVVEHGQADQMYIATSGLGWRSGPAPTGWRTVQPGDAIIVSGTLGDHGAAILAARAALPLVNELRSDAAPLHGLVAALLTSLPQTRWLRDPTRGGLAAALNELAEQAALELQLDEAAIPVDPAVHSAAEVLGLDPLYLANEGKFIAVCPTETADAAVAVLRQHPLGRNAARIGVVTGRATHGSVVMATQAGGRRIVDMPSGVQMPRIC